MSEWAASEWLQLFGVLGSFAAAILSFLGVRMAKTIHIMINSRMAQMIEGAKAEGGMAERAAADLRARAQETRSDTKDGIERENKRHE
jgi:hypothetical protein